MIQHLFQRVDQPALPYQLQRVSQAVLQTRPQQASRNVIRYQLQRVGQRARQECQWSGQKLSGSAECVWLSLKFTHYQIFY
ncbi:hypothetical protein EFP27_14710 [Lacticaseibacillus paracasei]|nr:hypothetical protein [Lacticaseibacillus paracasei]